MLAHRGASRLARENTVEAFRRAREVGADGVELDVRRSADGIPLVHHDASASDGIGLLVARPYAEIRAAAPWLPTLDEALVACEGMLVNVEIKCSRWEPDADPEHVVARTASTAARATTWSGSASGSQREHLISTFTSLPSQATSASSSVGSHGAAARISAKGRATSSPTPSAAVAS